MSDASFLSDVCSAYSVVSGMRDMEAVHEDGERGRKRHEREEDDEDLESKHLRMMTADEQRRYLRENHSQIEKRRRDKMNTHIKVRDCISKKISNFRPMIILRISD